jgi:hypothetical protein
MDKVLRKYGLPSLTNAGNDKVGRGQLMYQLLRNRISVGETDTGQALQAAQWQIANTCTG